MSDAKEFPLEAVPARARRAREIPIPWVWVEPTVWTERMLTALIEGVKGGVWYSLMDKVHPQRALYTAYSRVAANEGAAGVDHVTVTMFEDRLEENLKDLSDALRTGTYRPQAIRRHWIPKPGNQEKRPLGIPTVRDRVVQTALRQVLEPIFERDFAAHSYGFRPGRGCKDALRRVEELLKGGFTHVVDADLKSDFDTIPHDRLLALVAKKVADGKVLNLIDAFLHQGVLDDLEVSTPEQGTPQGAVISPLLSNIYLDPLDHLMAESGFEMVRYADDVVILCRSSEEAAQAMAVVQEWTASAGLTLHPTKTRIIAVRTESFDFLGYRFEDGTRRPRPKSLDKFKETVRTKTTRTTGGSLSAIIASLNPTLRGWFEYFKHSHKWTFERLDGWIRMRLRSLLRKRMKKRGRGRGTDHQRWPNAFFADHGLFSLERAHELASQSSLR
ncbi:RNA-directed DNA polymerase [Singulisphaera sp. GP187]|uniref:group II intron reverse transcriptase/maturase n=1 Tax=Singulisphaera sp. GP187 TaxID=1882752 RepID=UPI00092905A1|nr:group II intron reverse transcriptase/maturase [Singulisphaera sp. GP187]SIO15469.1 RNA-directed DNA polymerase [Singulisphaera sp. GP187]